MAARLESDLIEELMFAGAHVECLQRIEQASVDFDDVPEVLAEILLLGANLREVSGDYSGALVWAESAGELLQDLPADAVPSDFVEVYAATIRAKILLHIGVLDEASRVLEEAQSVAIAHGTQRTKAMLLVAEVELAQARGNRQWVLDHLQVALDGSVFDSDPYMRSAMEAELRLAQGQLALQSNQALEAARDALVAYLDELGLDDPLAWAPALLVCDLHLALGDVESAREAVRLVSEALGRSEGWIPLLVRSHRAGVLGRVHLHESTAGDDSIHEVIDACESALSDLLDAWESIPHRSGGVGFLHFDVRRSLLATLASLYAAQSGSRLGAERTLETLLRVEARGSLAEVLGVEANDLEALREHLVPPEGGLLVFIPSASGSVAITLDTEGAATWRLPSSDSWERVSERLALEMQPDQAEDPGSEERLRFHAESVRDLVLPADLDAHISTWNSVLFVRAENMGRIPLQVLPLVGRGGRPLGLEIATAYLPSLRVGLGLVERSQRSRSTARDSMSPEKILFAVGPIASEADRDGSSTPTIPWDSSNERLAKAPWKSGTVRIELAPERALASVLDAGRAGYEFVAIVSHGTRDSTQEGSQGFGFDPEVPVFPSTLRELSASPLAVLLVCGASAGQLRRGDDLGSHLNAIFLEKGAEVVASSDTDLSFAASMALLDVFQRELARGEAPAFALRTARRHIAGTAAWSHPAYHSTLSLTGLGFAPPAPRLLAAASPESLGLSRAAQLLTLALLAVAAALLMRRRRAS